MKKFFAFLFLFLVNVWSSTFASNVLQIPTARFEDSGIFSISAENVDSMTDAFLSYQWGDSAEIDLHRKVSRDSTSYAGKYDNSLDLKFLLNEESKYIPAIALGFNSLSGDYNNESEFLAFSKRFYDWDWHLGFNWGTSARGGKIKNPFSSLGSHFSRSNDKRIAGDRVENLFTGERIALTAGVSYKVTDNFKLNLNYGQKDYVDYYFLKKAKSPFSIRGDYEINNFTVSAGVENMNKLMTKLSYKYDTKKIKYPYEKKIKEINQDKSGKINLNPSRIIIKSKMKDIDSYGASLENSSAELWIEATEGENVLQNVLNASRVLYENTDDNIKWLSVVHSKNNINGVRTSILRKDLEGVDTKNASMEKLIRKAEFSSAYKDYPMNSYKNFFTKYAFLEPIIDLDVSQKNRSVVSRESLLAGMKTEVFANDWRVGFAGRFNLQNNMKRDLPSYSNITSEYEFARKAVTLENLYARKTYRPFEDLYLDIQAGFLEERFYGYSSELLYKPVFDNWGVGLGMNMLYAREPKSTFAYNNEENYSPVFTIYYEPDSLQNTIIKLSYLEYVAKDKGLALSAEKSFENGIRLKAYSNFSNDSDESYVNTNSFRVNAGLRLSFPLGYGSKHNKLDVNFAPLNTYTGRFLNKPENLYDDLNEVSYNKLVKSFKPAK